MVAAKAKTRVVRFGNGEIAFCRPIEGGMIRFLTISHGLRRRRDLPGSDFAWTLKQSGVHGARYLTDTEILEMEPQLTEMWTALAGTHHASWLPARRQK